MPRTELPSRQPDDSPNWVEWRDTWMAGDRFHVKAAVVYRTTVPIGGRASATEVVQESDGANDDRQRLALWGQIITDWSFASRGIPVPSQNAAGPEVIWTTLSGPDFNALAEATQPLLDEVTAVPTSTRNAKASSTS